MRELPKICNRIKQDLYNLYKYVQENFVKTIKDLYNLSYGNQSGGVNIFNMNTVSGVRYTRVNYSIPAGTYTLSSKVTSSDTDATTSRIIFRDSDGYEIAIATLSRGVRSGASFTLSKEVSIIDFYASTNFQTSDGDTFSYTDIQIEEGTTSSDYKPYIMSNKQLTDARIKVKKITKTTSQYGSFYIGDIVQSSKYVIVSAYTTDTDDGNQIVITPMYIANGDVYLATHRNGTTTPISNKEITVDVYFIDKNNIIVE